MRPQISEFSYGFALTNEIVGWLPLKAAPIFPSLIEEGKAGGGYDVKIDQPGVPLFLQFKRADRMVTRGAKEIRTFRLWKDPPFFRFSVTQMGVSNQHEMLLRWDDGFNEVYYAAPKFSAFSEIDDAWAKGEVTSRSIFVRPQSIGALDEMTHHVAYKGNDAFLCSTPRKVEHIDGAGLVERLQTRVAQEDRSLDTTLVETEAALDQAITKQREADRIRELTVGSRVQVTDGGPMEEDEPLGSAGGRLVPTTRPRALEGIQGRLRSLADKSMRYLGAQLIVVQTKNL